MPGAIVGIESDRLGVDIRGSFVLYVVSHD